MNSYTTALISASFECGGHVQLKHSWDSYHVICPHNKIFYVLDGEFVMETNGKRHLCTKGDMVVLPAGVRHSYYLTQKGHAEKYWMHCTLKQNNTDLFANYALPVHIHMRNADEAAALFEHLLACTNRQDGCASLSVTADMLRLVELYLQEGEIQAAGQVRDAIDDVIDYIKSNYTESIDLKSLAQKSNLSPNHLIRKFKSRTGYSPIQYSNYVKMEMVRFLILNTNRSIGSIMEQVGFLDAAHFSKMFRQYSGYSPRKYREIFGNQPFHIPNLVLHAEETIDKT